MGCHRNRSKYQPKGHFDAAVGGRRRQHKAAAGSALEKLRRRRQQQSGLTSDLAPLPANAPPAGGSTAPETSHMPTSIRPRNWQHRRFVDDQAAGGGESSGTDAPDSPSPNSPQQQGRSRRLHRDQTGAVAGAPGDAANVTTTSSSSSTEEDQLLVAGKGKRPRSRSLQRHLPGSDDDSLASPGVSDAAGASQLGQAAAPGLLRSNPVTAQAQQQLGGRSSSKSLHQILGIPRGGHHHSERDGGAAKQLNGPVAPGSAAAVGQASGSTDDEGRKGSPGRMQLPDLGDTGEAGPNTGREDDKHDEEEPAAFEVPSQMPRELQSWAWDK